jgi:opacity protein-like surface antigen
MKQALFLVCALPLTSHAGGTAPPIAVSESPPRWEITSAFYVPLMGLDGSLGLLGIGPSDVDSSFSDVLDVMDAGLSGAVELRNGPWTLQADAIWLKLSDSAEPLAGSRLDFGQEQFTGSLAASYDVYADDTTSLRLIAGAAISHMKLDLDFITPPPLSDLSRSDSQTWIDPLIGIGVRHSPGERWALFADGLYGGFGVSSEEYWQVVAGAGYRFTDHMSIALAYRVIAIDYRQGGFVYDTETSGPNIGLIVRF